MVMANGDCDCDGHPIRKPGCWSCCIVAAGGRCKVVALTATVRKLNFRICHLRGQNFCLLSTTGVCVVVAVVVVAAAAGVVVQLQNGLNNFQELGKWGGVAV